MDDGSVRFRILLQKAWDPGAWMLDRGDPEASSDIFESDPSTQQAFWNTSRNGIRRVESPFRSAITRPWTEPIVRPLHTRHDNPIDEYYLRIRRDPVAKSHPFSLVWYTKPANKWLQWDSSDQPSFPNPKPVTSMPALLPLNCVLGAILTMVLSAESAL